MPQNISKIANGSTAILFPRLCLPCRLLRSLKEVRTFYAVNFMTKR